MGFYFSKSADLEMLEYEHYGIHGFRIFNMSTFRISIYTCFVDSQWAHMGPRAQHGPHVPYGDSHVLTCQASEIYLTFFKKQ